MALHAGRKYALLQKADLGLCPNACHGWKFRRLNAGKVRKEGEDAQATSPSEMRHGTGLPEKTRKTGALFFQLFLALLNGLHDLLFRVMGEIRTPVEDFRGFLSNGIDHFGNAV